MEVAVLITGAQQSGGFSHSFQQCMPLQAAVHAQILPIRMYVVCMDLGFRV